jgi:transposase
MRKIREILRLKAEAAMSDRKIAAVIGSSRSTVQECLRRCRQAGIGWPLPAEVDEAALIARLYQRAAPARRVVEIDFGYVHRELARRGVTRELLWQEHKAGHPEGVQYTAFCNQYRRWLATQELVLRQEHLPGDKGFVDYAGQTVPVVDRLTGEVRQAQIFICVLGCSNYTFAEATLTQASPDWLGSHVRAVGYFGGTPAAFVPDNLKSAVTKARRYEPDLNRAYSEFAEHYGVAILPARVRKPRDKAKVESGVLIVERWILARLRNRTFFCLAELNAAIAKLLEHLNTRPFKKMAGCRRSRFLELDKPALCPLPPRPYEFAEWKKSKVHPDYHIEVGRAYYSVPYRLIGERVDVRVTAGAVEIFHAGALIAAHARASERGRRSTRTAHRPDKHIAVIENTLARTLKWARDIGPATAQVIQNQAAQRKHPEETLRSAQGILRLAKDFSPAQLEAACQRALALKSYGYRAVRTLLENPVSLPVQPALDLAHENVRGPEYFQ